MAIADGFSKDDVGSQLVVKTGKAVEVTPEVVYVTKEEIFDPTKTLNSQQVVNARPHVD